MQHSWLLEWVMIGTLPLECRFNSTGDQVVAGVEYSTAKFDDYQELT